MICALQCQIWSEIWLPLFRNPKAHDPDNISIWSYSYGNFSDIDASQNNSFLVWNSLDAIIVVVYKGVSREICISWFRNSLWYSNQPSIHVSFTQSEISFLIVGSCAIQDHELRQVWKEATVMTPWVCYRVPVIIFFLHSSTVFNLTHLSRISYKQMDSIPPVLNH